MLDSIQLESNKFQFQRIDKQCANNIIVVRSGPWTVTVCKSSLVKLDDNEQGM